MIVDAQVHVWARATLARPWVSGGELYCHRPEPFGADELVNVMDAAGVDRAVLVPPSWEGYRNDVVRASAARYPSRFGWMARLRLDQRERASELLRGRAVMGGALGVRLTFARGVERRWLEDGTAEWFWREAERLNLAVMVFAPGRSEALEGIARRFPSIRLIVDHLGIPTDASGQPLDQWIRPLLKLSELPNVSVKASALPCAVSEPYPFPTARRVVRKVTSEFGASRVFWGSDLTRLPCAYEDAVNFLREGAEILTDQELRMVMGEGLAAALRWP